MPKFILAAAFTITASMAGFANAQPAPLAAAAEPAAGFIGPVYQAPVARNRQIVVSQAPADGIDIQITGAVERVSQRRIILPLPPTIGAFR